MRYEYTWVAGQDGYIRAVVKDEPKPDPIVEKNVALLRARSAVGIAKYGVTLERDDIDLLGWLKHAREECADQLNYLTAAIERLEAGK